MSVKNVFGFFKNKLWLRIFFALMISVAFMMSFSVVFPITKIEHGASYEEFSIYLDERIPKIMKAYDIPGVNVSLIKDGAVILTKAFGYADLATGKKMTPDTYLRVESISKSVTAWGVMKLAEQGKINLDSPAGQYLKGWNFPEAEFSTKEITIRQLLSHTSGLPLGDFTKRYDPTSPLPSLKDCLTAEAIPNREPGTSFSYSNVGFNLLELLIEEVTGSDFSQFMQQEVLTPLGMNNAGFAWSELFDPAVPNGHDLAGNAVPLYVYPEKGSGGLFATAGDIAAFVAAGMPSFAQNHSLLSLQSIDMLYTPTAENLGLYGFVFDSYGLGYYIENLSNGLFAVSHGGQGAGWMTHFHSVPKTGDGIVILTNSQRSWPFIAYILSDWAKWSGLPAIGMSRIVWAIYGLWAILGLACFGLLLQMWRLAEGIACKKRRFATQVKDFGLLRILQISISVVLMAGLMWCVFQDYLFFTSIFPIISGWFGVLVVVLAAVLLLSALLPEQEQAADY